MNARLIPLLMAAGLLAGGCATVSDAIDSINPFASSGPKMAPLAPLKASVDVKALWSVSIGKSGDYAFTPAVVDRTVYAASKDSAIVKLEDGKVVWKINAGQPLSAGVGANSTLLVVGTPKGEVLAFSTADGKLLWKAMASSEILAAPAVGDDGVAVKSGDNRVFLFDAADGGRKWVYQRSTPALSVRGTGAPAFADRYLFVGFPGGKLVALSLQNGAPVWEGPVAMPKGATELDRVADVVAAPAIESRQICAVAFQGRVACFDMGQGGAIVWSRDISSARGLALDGRYLFVTDDEGVVYGLDRLSGGSLWKQDKLRHRLVTAPVVHGDSIVVADGEGYIHFLSREEGAFVARMKTDGKRVDAAPQRLSNGAVLVQTTGGDLRAVSSQ